MHEYGSAEFDTLVKTTFGTFALCRACVNAGHMQGDNA